MINSQKKKKICLNEWNPTKNSNRTWELIYFTREEMETICPEWVTQVVMIEINRGAKIMLSLEGQQ